MRTCERTSRSSFALAALCSARCQFLLRAPAAFFERLHPQGFGDMGHRFRQAVQSGGTCIKTRGKGFPPGIEQRVDGVGRAFADFGADLFDGGALTGTQQRVGGVADVALGDAAGQASVAVRCSVEVGM